MSSYDQKQKAITENLLITSEAQLTEMRNKFDTRISELVKRTDDHAGQFELTELKIVDMGNQSNKIEENILHTNKEVEEIKQKSNKDRELVVMKIKEQKETLESFFNSLEEKIETIETTQTKEVGQIIKISKN